MSILSIYYLYLIKQVQENDYKDHNNSKKVTKLLMAMQSLFKQLQTHRLLREEMQEQHERVLKRYYNPKQHIDNAKRSKAHIQQILDKLQDQQIETNMREFVLHHKIAVHPSRSVFEVSMQSGNSFGVVDGQTNLDIEKIITQNCCISIQFKPIRIYPVHPIDPNPSITPKSLRFLLYHLQKHQVSSQYSYSKANNLHKGTNSRKQILHLQHQITLSNYDAIKQLLMDQSNAIYLYVENQFRVIVALCKVQLAQVWIQGEVKGKAEGIRMIKFEAIGTGLEMFTLQAQLYAMKVAISPMIWQLQQKMHLKRVVINETNRSRSPSPTVHRQTAKSLIKQSFKSRYLQVMNKRSVKVSLKPVGPFEQPLYKPAILNKQNITEHCIIQVKQSQAHNPELYLQFQLQDQKQEGYIQFKLQDIIYKVVVTNEQILQMLTLDKSKQIFGSDEPIRASKNSSSMKNALYSSIREKENQIKREKQKQMHMSKQKKKQKTRDPVLDKFAGSNKIIVLTQFAYIRPSEIMQIYDHTMLGQHKISKMGMGTYFVKGDVGIDAVWGFPIQIRQLNVVEGGINILYSCHSSWIGNKKQLKVIIACKTKAKKSTIVNNEPLYKQAQMSQSNNYYESYINIYLFRVQILEAESIEAVLNLEVSRAGIYEIQTSTILLRNSRYRLECSKPHILHIINPQISTTAQKTNEAVASSKSKYEYRQHEYERQDKETESLKVQLLQQIQIKEYVEVYIYDLTRGVTRVIGLHLLRKEYWLNTHQKPNMRTA